MDHKQKRLNTTGIDDLFNAMVFKLCSHGIPVFHLLCASVLPQKLNSGYVPIHKEIIIISSILSFCLINIWYLLSLCLLAISGNRQNE